MSKERLQWSGQEAIHTKRELEETKSFTQNKLRKQENRPEQEKT